MLKTCQLQNLIQVQSVKCRAMETKPTGQNGKNFFTSVQNRHTSRIQIQSLQIRDLHLRQPEEFNQSERQKAKQADTYGQS